MRSTFYTRCMQLGINRDCYSMYVGHELGGMAKRYAKAKPEILVKVAKAIHYAEPVEAAWGPHWGRNERLSRAGWFIWPCKGTPKLVLWK